MRVFVTFAFLCLLQAMAGPVATDHKHENHINKPVHQVQHHGDAGHQDHETNSHHHAHKEQHVAGPSEQHVVQHVTEASQSGVKVQQTPPHESKVSVAIPPKVQQIVTQVSQHIPQVIEQHIANKQRVVRAVKKPLDWQEMQVNAVPQPGRCEFICNPVDATVCGHNGLCYWEFASQCDLSTYNCLNTQKTFDVVDFAKCQDISAAKCYRGDM